MNKSKVNLILHILAQVLAQSAVIAVVPLGGEKYIAAIVAVIGVLVAFSDQSLSNQ